MYTIYLKEVTVKEKAKLGILIQHAYSYFKVNIHLEWSTSEYQDTQTEHVCKLEVDGLISGSSSLHVEVSLGKIVKPKLPHWSVSACVNIR